MEVIKILEVRREALKNYFLQREIESTRIEISPDENGNENGEGIRYEVKVRAGDAE